MTTKKCKTEKNYKVKTDMIRSNSKQSGGIHAVKAEERKGKAAVGSICRKGRY